MAEKQVVVFLLGGQDYGIDILKIQEITKYVRPTKIPEMSEYMEGIINLRGYLVPVLNLRKRFNLENGKQTGDSRIIVVGLDDKKKAGLLVDGVSQVTKIDESFIELPQDVDVRFDRELMTGLAKKDDKIIILLDSAALLDQNTENIMEKTQFENSDDSSQPQNTC